MVEPPKLPTPAIYISLFDLFPKVKSDNFIEKIPKIYENNYYGLLNITCYIFIYMCCRYCSSLCYNFVRIFQRSWVGILHNRVNPFKHSIECRVEKFEKVEHGKLIARNLRTTRQIGIGGIKNSC